MPLTESGVREHPRDVVTGLLTPFGDDPGIEHSELAANATTLYDGGTRVFLTSAGVSECRSLTRQERVDVTTTAIDTLPSDVCVLADVGGNTANMRKLIDAYDHIDIDGVMIMPPDHTCVHKRDLLRCYEKLAEASTTPLVPYIKGFDPSISYLRDLTGLDGMVGIKCAIGDAVRLGAAASTTGDDVVQMDGLAEPFAISFWDEGIEGFSTGASNFRPEVGPTLFEVLTEENWGRTRELRNIYPLYQNLRDQAGQDNSLSGAISVPAVKKGLELAGLRGGVVREPARSLSTDDEHHAEELHDQLDDGIERLIN